MPHHVTGQTVLGIWSIVDIPSTSMSSCSNTLVLLSAQCISSIVQIIKSVCVCVSEWVSLSHETSWMLYSSQSSTDLHQTWHQGRVPGDVVIYCFLVEIWKIRVRQASNAINFHHCLYGKIALMSNISILRWGQWMAPWPLTSDDLELS